MFLRTLVILFLTSTLAETLAEDAHAPAAHAAPAPASAPHAEPPKAAPKELNDLRIVIDTSGSMRQNDPRNLRVPALKLLINLLPEGQRAGIWLFDAKPEALIPLGTVDHAWRVAALAAVGKIHSKGLFTHIEAALEAAAQDWTTPAAHGGHRNLILLTDGMVDISKNAEESAASRERLLKTLLPRLQLAGARVHTIALSDQSDQALMNQMALATNGWNEHAGSAEQLQRGFVQIFNQAAPPDTVPLTGNRFEVDASIMEFTILITLRPGASPSRLVGPDGAELNQAHLPENARWVHEAGYDLVTVQSPAHGTWTLDADVDPGNQVMIVTDLQMDLSPLPTFLTPEDTPELFASFSERGAPVQREDFLSLLTLTARLEGGAAEGKTLAMPRDPSHPERFGMLPWERLQPGDYSLTVTANGQTFMRQANLSFHVMNSPLKVEVHEDGHNAVISVIAAQDTPLPGNLAIKATRTDQAGRSHPLEVHPTEGQWRLELPRPAAGEQSVVNFEASTTNAAGQTTMLPLKPVTLTHAATPAEAAHAPAETTHETSKPKPDWLITAALAIAINLVIVGLGYVGHRLFRKRSQAAVAALLGKLTP